jgi:PKD repeat protein
MKLIFSLLFTVLAVSAFTQQRSHDQLIPVSKPTSYPTFKSLEAIFTADVTEGNAPLTVSFTDQSTGNPTSWKWTFGDGDSSLLQNPVHIYQSTGSYTVKLSISDGTNGFALEKKDYIRVNVSYDNCDTLRFPLPEPLTYYMIAGKGYVTGNNSYGDKAICDFFETTQTNLVITGMICEFSKARQAAGNNEKIPVRIWNADASTGKPGTVLATDTILLSTLVNDVANAKVTNIDFKNPVSTAASFSMGIMLPVIQGDTVCFWSTSTGKLPVNTTWIQQSNNEWESAKTLWTPNGGPDFIISTAIYPKICLLEGTDETVIPIPFAVWPNPASDVISIVNQQSNSTFTTYAITDMNGKEFLKGDITDSISTLVDISTLKPGIYIIQFIGKSSIYSTKLVVK